MKPNLKLLTIEVVVSFVLIALVLFLAAGTVFWAAGWVFLVLFFGFTVAISGWLLKHDPELLTERLIGFAKPNVQTWDRVFYVLANVFFFSWLVLMAFDAVRFRWSQVPVWLQVVGAILLLLSFYLFFLTFRENAFLSPAVRVQTERKQTVVSTGPYRYVRHPLYATAFILVIGTALLLGSWYGLLYGLILVALIAYRTVQEERILREELPGYDEYMKRVKYRFIPHVW